MTKRVLVLDTQVFMNLQLDFSHPQFDRLEKNKKNQSFQIVIPRMVDLEVKQKLKNKNREIHNYLTRVQHFHKYFEVKPDALDDATNEALTDFECFKSRLNISIAEHESISCEDLVDLYNNMLPPFSERKKHEFPDAISLLSIDQVSCDFKDIISADGDWLSYYKADSKVRVFKSLPNYIDEKLREASEYISELKQKLLTPINYEHLLETIVDEFKMSYPIEINVNRVPQRVSQQDCINFRIKDINITEVKNEFFKTKGGYVFGKAETCFIELIFEFDVYIDLGRSEQVIDGKTIEVPHLKLITLDSNVSVYATLKNRAISSFGVESFYDLEWYIET